MFDWSKQSIGLVLSGGGAKGAYEIGCWKAMLDHGIKFKSVSGTSIGGINGYLICRGNYSEAKKIWLEMGEKTPLPRSFIRIGLALAERYCLVVFSAIHLIVIVPLVVFAALAAVIAVSSLVWWLTPQPAYPIRCLLFPLVIISLLIFERALRGTRLHSFNPLDLRFSRREFKRYIRHETAPEFSVFIGLVFIAVPLGFLLYDLAQGYSRWWFLLIPVCLIINLIGIMLNAEFGLSSFGDISLISSERLQVLLQSKLEGVEEMPAQPALYLTRLKEDSVPLPGKVPFEIEEMVKHIHPTKKWGEWTPDDLPVLKEQMRQLGLSKHFVDAHITVLGMEYVPLARRPKEEVADLLLSTSAIAEVLPRIEERLHPAIEADRVARISRAVFYDGGLVDNVPVAPLLEHEDCDIIIVIFLNHKINDPRAFLEDNLNQINQKLRRHNNELDDATYDKLKASPFLTPVRVSSSKLREVELIPVVPSEDLGNFVKGTLGFNREKVRRLIKLGEQDMKKALEEFTARKNSTAG